MLKLIDAISRFTVKQKAATSRKNFLKGIAAAIGSVPI